MQEDGSDEEDDEEEESDEEEEYEYDELVSLFLPSLKNQGLKTNHTNLLFIMNIGNRRRRSSNIR